MESWWVRLMRKPLVHSTNLTRVDRSPYPYGPCATHSDCWTLSTLSILHRWTGLTLEVVDPTDTYSVDLE